MKKFFAILLAALMVLALSSAVFATEPPVEEDPTTGTITVENATVGKDYAVYKIFDATFVGDNVSYTFTKTTDNAALYTKLTADDSPFVLTQQGTSDVYVVTLKETIGEGSDAVTVDDAYIIDFLKTIPVATFAPQQVGTAVTAAAPASDPEAETTTVVFEGLPFGYYFVTSTLGSAVTITNVTPDAEVVDKNLPEPHFDDQGKYMFINGEKVKINTANVGQQLDFVVPIDAYNYVDGEVVTKYTVTDTMPTGITLLTDTIKVYVDGTELPTTGYTLTLTPTDSTPKTGFTVEINWATLATGASLWNPIYNDKLDHLIEVKYSGVVNENITMSYGDSTTAAENVATFDYTTDHNNSFPDGEKPQSKTQTYSTGINLLKVDENDNALAGAQFQITGTSYGVTVVNGNIFRAATAEEIADTEVEKYYKVKDSNEYVKVTDYDAATDKPELEDDTKYVKVSVSGTEYTTTPIDATEWVGSDGKLSFTGLGAGFYTITETAAPDGYNPLTAPIYVNIVWVDEDATDPDNVVPAHFEYYMANADGSNKLDDNGDPIEFNPNQLVVENKTGSQLPETGGIGTRIFYVVGGLLMAAAVVLLVTRKKVSADRD